MKKIIIMLLMLAPMTAFAQKFAHVNSQDILMALPETKTMQTELENLQKQYEADLKSMQEEGQRKYEEYQKLDQNTPQNIRERKEKELNDISERLQTTAQENQQALQRAYQEKMQPIQTKVMDAIQQVGVSGGYVYVMEANSLPYISATLSTDITEQVKQKLGIK